MGEFLDPLNPAVNSFFEQGQAFAMQQTGDPALSQLQSLQTLADLRHQQAASLAYFDDFWLFGVLAAPDVSSGHSSRIGGSRVFNL